MTFRERFWAKVEKDGPILIDPLSRTSSPCWIWSSVRNRVGYGQFGVPPGKVRLAHRVSYELEVGLIPEGFTIDHLCRNTTCVNPSHLEAVTLRENILRGTSPSAILARKTHCSKGHPLSGSNLYVNVNANERQCRLCHNARQAAYLKRKKADRGV